MQLLPGVDDNQGKCLNRTVREASAPSESLPSLFPYARVSFPATRPRLNGAFRLKMNRSTVHYPMGGQVRGLILQWLMDVKSSRIAL